jgi:hypothetical protein
MRAVRACGDCFRGNGASASASLSCRRQPSPQRAANRSNLELIRPKFGQKLPVDWLILDERMPRTNFTNTWTGRDADSVVVLREVARQRVGQRMQIGRHPWGLQIRCRKIAFIVLNSNYFRDQSFEGGPSSFMKQRWRHYTGMARKKCRTKISFTRRLYWLENKDDVIDVDMTLVTSSLSIRKRNSERIYRKWQPAFWGKDWDEGRPDDW